MATRKGTGGKSLFHLAESGHALPDGKLTIMTFISATRSFCCTVNRHTGVQLLAAEDCGTRGVRQQTTERGNLSEAAIPLRVQRKHSHVGSSP